MRERPLFRHAERGFTLIELMVVIVIVGLASAAVVLAMPERGGSVQAEAQRFAARAKAARDSAIIESRPVALLVGADGYDVARRVRGEWRPGGHYDWAEGTVAQAGEGAQARVRFDSTGLADPLQVTLRRGRRQAAVEIAADGTIRVRR
ncbi:MAG TPA: GspH/FimT family pseudopilin [Allosphingosinicella sp.]|jgi:general secretion pathway protein H|nr:GspH/FimT family pseudopilin [Allosphingosinicella sp.]